MQLWISVVWANAVFFHQITSGCLDVIRDRRFMLMSAERFQRDTDFPWCQRLYYQDLGSRPHRCTDNFILQTKTWWKYTIYHSHTLWYKLVIFKAFLFCCWHEHAVFETSSNSIHFLNYSILLCELLLCKGKRSIIEPSVLLLLFLYLPGMSYPVGIVPPRTKSPVPESSSIASYVTLRKSKKPDPRTVSL